jgi:hypothetical protein
MTEDQFARFVDYVEGWFQRVATKDDLLQLATKEDLARVEARLDAFTREIRERFDDDGFTAWRHLREKALPEPRPDSARS